MSKNIETKADVVERVKPWVLTNSLIIIGGLVIAGVGLSSFEEFVPRVLTGVLAAGVFLRGVRGLIGIRKDYIESFNAAPDEQLK